MKTERLLPYGITIVYDPDDDIFVASVPELPGCRTHGKDYDEAIRKVRRAITAWIGAAVRTGEAIPSPIVHHFAGETGS